MPSVVTSAIGEHAVAVGSLLHVWSLLKTLGTTKRKLYVCGEREGEACWLAVCYSTAERKSCVCGEREGEVCYSVTYFLVAFCRRSEDTALFILKEVYNEPNAELIKS